LLFGGGPVEIFAFFESGLGLVVFYSITLQAERVILDPTRI
jgi:hypothetical protein